MRLSIRLERTVFAVLILFALAIAFDSCSARTKAFHKQDVPLHQPKFKPSR